MFEKEIRKFRELLHIGMSSMKETAEIYVKVIDREPAAKQAFRELVLEVPSSAWKLMEKVGRGQMHERLLLMGGRMRRHRLQTGEQPPPAESRRGPGRQAHLHALRRNPVGQAGGD